MKAGRPVRRLLQYCRQEIVGRDSGSSSADEMKWKNSKYTLELWLRRLYTDE